MYNMYSEIGILLFDLQTILSHEHLPLVFECLKVSKLRGLGGKLGDSVMQELGCQTVGELSKLTLAQIKQVFDEKTSQVGT